MAKKKAKRKPSSRDVLDEACKAHETLAEVHAVFHGAAKLFAKRRRHTLAVRCRNLLTNTGLYLDLLAAYIQELEEEENTMAENEETRAYYQVIYRDRWGLRHSAWKETPAEAQQTAATARRRGYTDIKVKQVKLGRLPCSPSSEPAARHEEPEEPEEHEGGIA